VTVLGIENIVWYKFKSRVGGEIVTAGFLFAKVAYDILDIARNGE